jgi:dipeptidyl aminopeptidase/acylaminoacyl peptidase
MGNSNVAGLSFSPDGSKILVSSDASGVFNAYVYPVGGGDPVQLTHSTGDAIRTAEWLPDGERFLYLSDQGGNELHHVYVHRGEGEALLQRFYDADRTIRRTPIAGHVRHDFERARPFMDTLIAHYGGYRHFRHVQPSGSHGGHRGSWDRDARRWDDRRWDRRR